MQFVSGFKTRLSGAPALLGPKYLPKGGTARVPSIVYINDEGHALAVQASAAFGRREKGSVESMVSACSVCALPQASDHNTLCSTAP